MKNQNIIEDERTIAVQNASYRLTNVVFTFGLLIIALYRSVVFKQSCWDLLGLAFLGGLVATIHQASHRILSQHHAILIVKVSLLGAAMGSLGFILFHHLR